MKADVAEHFRDLEQVIKESVSHADSEREVLDRITRTSGALSYFDALDPDELYREVVFNRDGPLSAIVGENFAVLARPGESPEAPPQVGDILLRVAEGEPGLGYVAVISDSTLRPYEQMANTPYGAESQQPGWYAPVIGGGTFSRTGPFGRLVLSLKGSSPPGQLLLRMKSPMDEKSSVETLTSSLEGVLVDEEPDTSFSSMDLSADVDSIGTTLDPSELEHDQVFDLLPGSSTGLSEARIQLPTPSSNARLEWVDLNLVRGGDGRDHLYYLTSGDPDRGRAIFKLKVTNPSSRTFRGMFLKLRLSSRKADRTYQTIPLRGQGGGDFLRLRLDGRISPGRDRVIPIVISRPFLENAYDPVSPLTRLEAEFHWRQGRGSERRFHYARRTLGFYLFRQVEFLIDTTGRYVDEVRFEEPRHRGKFWVPIHEKAFKTGDRSPVTVTSTITTSVATSGTDEISYSARNTEVRERGGAEQVTTKTGAKLGFGVKDVLEAGVTSEVATSRTLTWSQSLAQEFTAALRRSRTFTSSLTRTLTVKWEIRPVPPGKINMLYVYPIFNRYRVTVVRFGQANSLGQATRRQVIQNFPILLFSHWGTSHQVIDSRRSVRESGESVEAQPPALQRITHAGPYRLAYDRLTTLGVIEPLPGRHRRRFSGTAALQAALNNWATYIPRVMQPPNYILTGGLTVNKPGEHGRGNAIDVDGFWWSSTNKFLAVNAPTDWYRYLTIEATLRKAFGTVLNYDYNAAHHDHWHCDLGRSTAWRAVRSQANFAQRALNEIWGENLKVDGQWGKNSRAAAARHGYDFSVAGGWDHFLDNIINRQSTPHTVHRAASRAEGRPSLNRQL